jgi:hypothetical protein
MRPLVSGLVLTLDIKDVFYKKNSHYQLSVTCLLIIFKKNLIRTFSSTIYLFMSLWLYSHKLYILAHPFPPQYFRIEQVTISLPVYSCCCLMLYFVDYDLNINIDFYFEELHVDDIHLFSLKIGYE